MNAFAATDVLLVFALQSEERGLFEGFAKIHCGVGKVNAAYGLTRALYDWRAQKGAAPSCVINLGSAGSQQFRAGELINCTRFYQRDMDTTALGTPAYATPFDDGPIVLDNGLRATGYAEGICGSGDSFVTLAAATPWNVIDMEAYALAKICALEKVPFTCVKFITDGADGHAASTWEAALTDAAKGLRQALDALMSG